MLCNGIVSSRSDNLIVDYFQDSSSNERVRSYTQFQQDSENKSGLIRDCVNASQRNSCCLHDYILMNSQGISLKIYRILIHDIPPRVICSVKWENKCPINGNQNKVLKVTKGNVRVVSIITGVRFVSIITYRCTKEKNSMYAFNGEVSNSCIQNVKRMDARPALWSLTREQRNTNSISSFCKYTRDGWDALLKEVTIIITAIVTKQIIIAIFFIEVNRISVGIIFKTNSW